MIRFAASAALTLLLLPAAVAPARAACDEIGFRIWYKSGQPDTYHHQGETIVLPPGQEVHLYVNHASKSKTPYATSAEVGYAAAFGIRGGHDPRGVLALKAQNDRDRQDGRLVMETVAPGRATLGYRITAVSMRGVFEQLPEACRSGRIEIEVRAGDGGEEEVELTPNRAARQLVHLLRRSLIFWRPPGTIDAQEAESVRRGGEPALIELAASILASDAFREEGWDATLERHHVALPDPDRVIDLLLGEIHQRLYDGRSVTAEERREQRARFRACVGERRAAACRDLATALIKHPYFAEQNRQRLAAIGG
ncbi:MAG: hypothetical protein D6696_05735 [Acidobacteria bacterium]|nr:MAG: hypothetical protein D6696_05735 [Acidobacteriota bacterium]